MDPAPPPQQQNEPRGAPWGWLAVALFGLATFAFFAGLSTGARPAAADQRSQTYVQSVGMPALAKSVVANAAPASDKEAAARDVAAQEAMAAWAFWMVAMAGLQVLVSVVGIYFISATLRANQESTKAARQSSEAALKSLSLAQIQQRAWIQVTIKIEQVQTGDGGFWAHGVATCVNVGQTPATNVRVHSKCFNAVDLYDKTGQQLKYNEFIDSCAVGESTRTYTILPGKKLKSGQNFEIKKEDIDAFLELTQQNYFCPVLVCCVTYRVAGEVGDRQTSAHLIYVETRDHKTLEWADWRDLKPENYSFRTGVYIDRAT